MTARSRIWAVAAAALLGAALLWAPAAFGHATLEGSSPQRGAIAAEQPPAVVFRFSEPVEASFGAVRVYDAGGEQVEQGEAFHPGGAGEKLGVRLAPDLPEGSYTATYRVLSADGHVVSGGFVFSIGRAGRAPGATVAELVAASESGSGTGLGLGVARGVQYASLALALGALAFLLLAWWPALRRLGATGEEWRAAERAFERRLRAVLVASAVAGALSAALGILFEAAHAAAVSATAALDPAVLGDALDTRFGTVWALTGLAWVLVGLSATPALRHPRPWRVAPLLVPLTFIALEPALSGHPSTQSPAVLLFPANFLHVLAASVWVGGLAVLLFVVPAATRRLEPPSRGRLLAALLARFSPLALACVAAILVTGIAQGYVYVRELDNLFETAYGRAVLIKLLLLVGALVPLGAYNRRRSVPRLKRIAAGGEAPGRAGLLLRRALRAELALLAAVIAVTAALAGYAPATSVQPGPYSGSAALGPAQLELTVDPARVGANQIHLYLFDAESGAQFEPIEQLEATATLPEKQIGPLALEPRRAGPGHYTVQAAQLGVAGEWELEVTVRVSAFDEYAAELGVPIR